LLPLAPISTQPISSTRKKKEVGLLGGVRVKETTYGTKKNKGAKQGAHAHEDTLQGRRWQWPVN
jgi:hypothetical protein